MSNLQQLFSDETGFTGSHNVLGAENDSWESLTTADAVLERFQYTACLSEREAEVLAEAFRAYGSNDIYESSIIDDIYRALANVV